MKKVKGFNEFTNTPITTQKEEKISINKYQTKLQKFYKDSGYHLYYASTFNTATIVLISLIDNMFPEYSLEDCVMLSVFSIAVLSKEGKDKTEKLLNYLHEHNIHDKDIEDVISIFTNVFEIYKAILKVSEKDIESFSDMLSDTGLLVPYLSVINNLIDNGFIDSNLFSKSLQEVKDELGEDRFKLLIHRILHKLNILTTNNHKFQNKDNVKPLKVNDEFKSPMYWTEDVVLKESLTEEAVIPDNIALWFMDYYAAQVVDFISINDIPEHIFKDSRSFIDEFYFQSKELYRGESRNNEIVKPIRFSPENGAGIAWTLDSETALAFTKKDNDNQYSYLYTLNMDKIKYPVSMDYVMSNITDEQIKMITNPITKSVFEKGYVSESEVLVFDTFYSNILKVEKVKDIEPVTEGKLSEETEDVKGQVERSKKLSKEMKEKILPLIIRNGIHGTRYSKGRVFNLKKQKVDGKSFGGVSIGADKDGFFVFTHRARSKSYPELGDIPNDKIKFVESTG